MAKCNRAFSKPCRFMLLNLEQNIQMTNNVLEKALTLEYRVQWQAATKPPSAKQPDSVVSMVIIITPIPHTVFSVTLHFASASPKVHTNAQRTQFTGFSLLFRGLRL